VRLSSHTRWGAAPYAYGLRLGPPARSAGSPEDEGDDVAAGVEEELIREGLGGAAAAHQGADVVHQHGDERGGVRDRGLGAMPTERLV